MGGFAALMLVPKTSVHKYNYAIFWKDNIRLSGQIFSLYPKAKSQTMQKRTNPYLWRSILSFDTGHQPTSFFRRKFIHFFT